MVKRELGKNQSLAREVNNKLVIDAFKTRPYSGTELASLLKLSNATVSSILNSLLSIDLIKVHSNDSINNLGRKRVTYCFNDKYSLILIVSITNFSINIVITNLLKEILVNETRNIEKYDMKTIYAEIIHIKDLMLAKEELHGVPLRNIIISLPGLINKNTGELQVSPQFDKTFFDNQLTILDVFKQSFNCDVYLENDCKLMMLGELSYGTFPMKSKGVLIYCDLGIGGALEFDNKIFLGSRGYAGELGLLKVNYEGKEDYLDEFASLRVLKEKINSKYNLNLSIKEIISEFKNGNKDVVYEVNENALILSKAIIEVVSVFDLDYFVIGGRAIEFGEDYLNIVRNAVLNEYHDVTIIGSIHDGKAIVDGAIDIAIEHILKQSLKAIKNKNN